MRHYVFLHCRSTSNIFPPIGVVACNIYRGSMKILFLNWLTATVSLLPLNSHKTAKPTDSSAPSTHIPQLSPFRIQSGVCPISSYCITARTSQFDMGTTHHKETPPIRKEDYCLIRDQSLVLDHVTGRAVLLDASKRVLTRFCCGKYLNVSSSYISRHRQG